MPFETSLLTAIVWLVAVQFMLYATGWLLNSAMLREERVAVLCWGGFMACIGAGFLLTAQRGEPRTWLAFNGSGIAFLGGLLLLWAGLVAFYRRPSLRREMLVTFAVLAAAQSLLGPEAELSSWRVLLAYAGNMWVTLRIVMSLHASVRQEYGLRLAGIIASPAVLIAAAFAVPIARQLANMDEPQELHRLDGSAMRSLFVFLVTAAIFNFAFMAMVTHRLLGRLRDLSERDALTNLYNRRAIERDLQREWQRWMRKRDRFSVLVVDLDHFKRINDTHGHAAGDEVLLQTARRLAAMARETDTVARVGGEEFLLLLPGTQRDGAWKVAERLLAQLREQPMTFAGQTLPVTASIGVSQVEAGDADPAAVLARADQALYRAKEQGRDRLVLLP
ncbi:MAG: GGDEF domain-containing protein [Piscinibacter sp.]